MSRKIISCKQIPNLNCFDLLNLLGATRVLGVVPGVCHASQCCQNAHVLTYSRFENTFIEGISSKYFVITLSNPVLLKY